MPNPALILCDTDAVVQLLLGRPQFPEMQLLRNYGVQLAIMPEVEIEITRPKFGRRIGAAMEKAVKRGGLVVLDEVALKAMAGKLPKCPGYRDITDRAETYVVVDEGEAHTFAAATLIGIPALSNDGTAIGDALEAGLELPTPVLRSFDLLAFCWQTGSLTHEDCERFLRVLRDEEGERVPSGFAHRSFKSGLDEFTPRLYDATKPRCGRVPRDSMPSPHMAVLGLTPLLA